jgi:tight adherence protein C
MALLLAFVTGLCIVGVFCGIRMYRADARLPGDLAVALEVGASRTTAVGSAVDRLGMRYAPMVLRMMGPKKVDKLRRRLDLAGNPGGLTVDRYAARRAVYGFLGFFGAFTMLLRGQTLLAVVLVLFGVFWIDVGIRAAIRQRKDVIERTLPDFLDVLAVVVSAGLGFRQALDRVADRYQGPWADELRITLRQMDMGVSRRQAFEELRKRNDSEQVAQFVSADRQRHAPHRRPERPAPRGQGGTQGHSRHHHVHGACHHDPARRRLRIRLRRRLGLGHRQVTDTPSEHGGMERCQSTRGCQAHDHATRLDQRRTGR